MDQSINEIKTFFSKAKSQASHKIKPFVIEMEAISVKRAKNLINDAQANAKMRAACLKNGISPQVIDGAYFEAQTIKMGGVGPTAVDFNPKKPGRQTRPEFKFKRVGVDFNGKKPNRQRTPKLNMPKMDFKPVNLFQPQKQEKFKPFNFPNFNIKMPKQKHKKHQGRFGSVDLMPGPKGSNELFIKPIFPGNNGKPLFNGPKAKGKKKPRISAKGIKMPKFKGLF